MSTTTFVTPEKARRYFNVSDNTLRKWDLEGKIETVRVGKHRRYKIDTKSNVESFVKEKICYARVSSFDQKEDLERQVSVISSKYPGYRIIKDIGSGLNFKRKGFNSLLESAIRGHIEEIVITNKDRLCRFGFELIESILRINNGKIVVLYDEDKSPDQELTDDVLSIITVFSAKVYGRRSHRNKGAKS
jgi:predicted site-specific integrase-resolvase